MVGLEVRQVVLLLEPGVRPQLAARRRTDASRSGGITSGTTTRLGQPAVDVVLDGCPLVVEHRRARDPQQLRRDRDVVGAMPEARCRSAGREPTASARTSARTVRAPSRRARLPRCRADRRVRDPEPLAQPERLREVAGGHLHLVPGAPQPLDHRRQHEHVRRVREVDPDPHALSALERHIAAMTCAACSAPSDGPIGTARFVRASSSVTGSRGPPRERRHRGLAVQRRPVVRTGLDAGGVESLRSASSACGWVTTYRCHAALRSVGRHRERDVLAEPGGCVVLRAPAPAGDRTSRRAPAAARGGSRPGARRGASCNRCTRTSACHASRGTGARAPAPRRSSSSVRIAPPSPKRRGSSTGRTRTCATSPSAPARRASRLRARAPARRPRSRARRARAAQASAPGCRTDRPPRSPCVRGVSAAATVSTVRFRVSGSTSQNTGRRADAGDRLGGRVERERRDHDLIARADSERAKADRDRVGPVGDADRVRARRRTPRTRPRTPAPPGRG